MSNSREIVLRVLVPKEEFDELKSQLKFYKDFYESHKESSSSIQKESSNLLKSGMGSDSVNSSEACSTLNEKSECECNHDKNPSSSPDQTVTVPNIVNSASTESKYMHPTHEEIIDKLWKRYQSKGRKLLNILNSSKDFSYDVNGMCHIGNLNLECPIIKLLQITVQGHSAKPIKHIQEYKNLLKKLNCEHLVFNKNLLVNDQLPLSSRDRYWYYLGS